MGEKRIKPKDNAIFPIIAIDFDDTISVLGQDTYPVGGKPRLWAKEVINFMHKLGIKIIIWTSRDRYRSVDHLKPMVDWLNQYEIPFDAINTSIQFAPYAYDGRKIYAHMYVDDRSYGWNGSDNGNDGVFLEILERFLYRVCRFSKCSANMARMCCENGYEPEEWMIEGVKNWKGCEP